MKMCCLPKGTKHACWKRGLGAIIASRFRTVHHKSEILLAQSRVEMCPRIVGLEHGRILIGPLAQMATERFCVCFFSLIIIRPLLLFCRIDLQLNCLRLTLPRCLLTLANMLAVKA